MNIVYEQNKNIEKSALAQLYGDAGWTAYTEDIDRLHQAVLQSYDVITAWAGEQLVGLVRTVSDGLTILYIQDILVLQTHQNRGIASTMMQMILNAHRDIRQKVLLTEEASDVRHFYEKNGFRSCDDGSIVAFALLG